MCRLILQLLSERAAKSESNSRRVESFLTVAMCFLAATYQYIERQEDCFQRCTDYRMNGGIQ